MKIIIECTAAEQTQIKQSIKINESDTLVIYKPINKKPEDMTCGEYVLSPVEWRINNEILI